MKKGLWGRKLGMTQIFEEDGSRTPVTVIQAEPNVIVGLRTLEKDGYTAVQIGVGDLKEKHATKPVAGQFKKAGVPLKRMVREFRLEASELEGLEVGAELGVDMFERGMRVDVAGVSKGKGFQGVLKRHHMAGMRATHGTHEARRNPGSIGNRKTPGRTFPNKRLPGHMGNKKVTTQNLTVAAVDADSKVVLLKGTVPGARGDLVLVRPAVKGQKKA